MTTRILFVYGTLRVRTVEEQQPGALINEAGDVRFLAPAKARGRLYEAYVGGYPIFVPDEDGDLVTGDLLEVDTDGAWWRHVTQVEEGAGYVLGQVKIMEAGELTALPRDGDVMPPPPDEHVVGVVWTWVWAREVDEDLRITSGDWLAAHVGFGDES